MDRMEPLTVNLPGCETMLKGDENMKKKWDLKINKYVVFDYNDKNRFG